MEVETNKIDFDKMIEANPRKLTRVMEISCVCYKTILNLVFLVVLNTVLINDTHMRHLAHGFIIIKTITNNEEIRNNETTIITLVTAAKRSILLAQYASLE